MNRLSFNPLGFLSRIFDLFTLRTLASDGAWYPAPSWHSGVNRRLPCNKRLQRQAHALRAKRRARRLGQA